MWHRSGVSPFPARNAEPRVPAQRPAPSAGVASARQVRGSFFPAISPRADERLIAVSKSLDFPAALRPTRTIPHAEGAEPGYRGGAHTIVIANLDDIV